MKIMKNKKPKKEEAKKEKKSSSRRKWVILLIAISAVALFIASSYFNFNEEQTGEQTNKTNVNQQETQQEPKKNEEFSSGIIIIEVTPTAMAEVTPVSKDRPIALSLKAPKNVSQGETFGVEIAVNPNGNNINTAQFTLSFAGLRADSFEFSAVPSPEYSGYTIEDGKISLLLTPRNETFPQTQFSAGTINFTAVFPVETKITFRRIDIVDSQLNNIYTVGEPATIFIG